MPNYQQHPSSFRDPSGFVFESAGKFYRQINLVYQPHYDLLMSTGLYRLLIEKRWLICHEETNSPIPTSSEYYKTILPAQISFVSYPYEWCFEQLKEAAILTLNIMRAAMNDGMTIKDATPYNVQFVNAKPLHIDSLSFEKYNETEPWVAYRQFCETFFYPLLITAYTGIGIHKLLAAFPEGIDAEATAELLPTRAKFNLGNWLHIFLAAKMKGSKEQKQVAFNKAKLSRIVDDLQNRLVRIQPLRRNKLGWEDYYDASVLSKEYLQNKQQIVASMIEKIEANTACDLGCNRGIFSSLLAKQIPFVVAVDEDEGSVASVHSHARNNKENILALCIDLANPVGDTGFNNNERKAFTKRSQYDVTLALAVVHHLCIGKNIPLELIANFLAGFTRQLIIEFVPADDEKAKQLLARKKLELKDYNKNSFEAYFRKHFTIAEQVTVIGSTRIIYRMNHKLAKN